MKFSVWILLGLLFTVFILTAVDNASALSLKATIPMGTAPVTATYDSGNGKIYVTRTDNTVAVISDTTNTIVNSINVGKYPYGGCYDSGKGEIFVTNLHDNTVSVISDSSDSVVKTISVGQSPYMCAYDSAKGEIYVTNQYDGTVSVISDETNTVIKTITVGSEPFGVVYDSGKGEIFVSNADSQKGNTISVISDTTHEVVATINVPSCQFLAYDSAKGEIFVSNYYSHSISVISDTTNTVVATISDIDDSQIEGLAYDSGRGEVFVALHNSNKIVPISDSTNQLGTGLTVGNGPWCITYDSAQSALYVTNGVGNDVSVLSDSGESSNQPSTGGFDWTWIIIIIIVIVLIIIILLWLNRSRDLKVTVKDSQTQTPIQGAKVTAEFQKDDKKNLSGVTENKGEIVFTKPEKGDYTIKASAAGYNPSTPVTVTVKGKTDVVVKLVSTGSKTQATTTSYEPVKQTQQLSTAASSIPKQSTPTVAPQPTVSAPTKVEQEAPELQGWKGNKIREYIETFKMKGAISPETALTAEELGLSRIFVRSMDKRKGETKYFVEVNGKYYLDQKALQESGA